MIDIDVSKIVSEIGEPTARLIENEDEKKQRRITVICSAVFLFLFICGSITFLVLRNKSKVVADGLSGEVKVLEENNKNLLDYERQANEIIRRNNSIKSILSESANWSYVFDKLEQVVPKGIVFSRFEVVSASDMRILGFSPDYVELSKLQIAMKDSGYFGNVAITNASLTTQGEKSVVNFAITFGFATKINRDSIPKTETTTTNGQNNNPNSTPKMPSDSTDSINTKLPVINQTIPDSSNQSTGQGSAPSTGNPSTNNPPPASTENKNSTNLPVL